MAISVSGRFKPAAACVIAASVLFFVACCSLPTAPASRALFYQPLHQDKAISAAQWQQLLQQARLHGYTELVLQWTQHDNSRLSANAEPLATILKTARQNQLTVWLGLSADSQYFQKMQQPDTERRQYFRQQLLHNQLQLQWLQQSALIDSPAIAGWYLPMELNDTDFVSVNYRDWLRKELALFSRSVHLPVAISLFSNGKLPVTEYLAAVDQLRDSGISLWWQDGAGAGLISAAYRALLLQKLPCQVGVISEQFRPAADTLRLASKSEIKQAEAAIKPCHKPLAFSLRYQSFSRGILAIPTG